MKTTLEFISHYLQDGKPRKLIHIVNAVRALGWEPSISAQYIGVYQCLWNHPELFKRVSVGTYRMLSSTSSPLALDQDQIRELIFDILKKKKKQSVAQVWRALLQHKIIVTYNATQHLLQSDMFTKDEYSRYSNEQ
jgi:hypothetical protein